MLAMIDEVVAWQQWLWVALICFGIGAVELVAGYRDNPPRALRTIPAGFLSL